MGSGGLDFVGREDSEDGAWAFAAAHEDAAVMALDNFSVDPDAETHALNTLASLAGVIKESGITRLSAYYRMPDL